MNCGLQRDVCRYQQWAIDEVDLTALQIPLSSFSLCLSQIQNQTDQFPPGLEFLWKYPHSRSRLQCTAKMCACALRYSIIPQIALMPFMSAEASSSGWNFHFVEHAGCYVADLWVHNWRTLHVPHRTEALAPHLLYRTHCYVVIRIVHFFPLHSQCTHWILCQTDRTS